MHLHIYLRLERCEEHDHYVVEVEGAAQTAHRVQRGKGGTAVHSMIIEDLCFLKDIWHMSHKREMMDIHNVISSAGGTVGRRSLEGRTETSNDDEISMPWWKTNNSEAETLSSKDPSANTQKSICLIQSGTIWTVITPHWKEKPTVGFS